MHAHIFVNLPVKDLQRSMAFFTALGYALNTQYSNDQGACFVAGDAISVMLTTHAKFKEFTPKAICDTHTAVEVLLNLNCDSREEVDALVAKALAAGGSTYDHAEDLGFMYSHSFVDPDGHGWGLFHVTPAPATA